MKIGFNAISYNSLSPGGLNRYTHGLIESFSTNAGSNMLFTSDTSVLGINSNSLELFPTPSILQKESTKASLYRLLYHQTIIPKLLQKKKVSLLYSPLPEGMLNPVTKQIITVHDLIPIIIPDSTKRLKYYYRTILPRLLNVSDAIITVSESTKKDIEKYYPTVETPIHVRHQGYNNKIFYLRKDTEIDKVVNKYNLTKSKYILAVGECRVYKNTNKMIQAFAKLNLEDIKLIIVGKLNKSDKNIAAIPEVFDVQEKVKFLGYVPDEDLALLYQGAKVFIFPSLYEGFGIPLLEAMACGVPIIASNTSSIPEVCGSAAIYFDPNDVDDMAKVISHVLISDELQLKLKIAGIERIKHFYPSHLSKATIDLCYQYAVG